MSDEEHARRVVTIIKQAKAPDEIMTLSAISNEWQRPKGAHPEDLIIGIDYARRQFWIERAGDHAVRLTSRGAAI